MAIRKFFPVCVLYIFVAVLGCTTDNTTTHSVQDGTFKPVDAEANDVEGSEVGGEKSVDQISSTNDFGAASDSGNSPCESDKGCFGDPCDGNEDCESGVCISHMGNFVCTDLCLEDCPLGWNCKQIQLSGTDLIFACVSDFAHLCQPCESNSDCVTGEIQDICVDYGTAGAFCGAPCEGQGDCPEGFECSETVSLEGNITQQCVNLEGVCECSEAAIKRGLSARCSNTNDFGTCHGARVCSEQGLGDCDAPVPQDDICNGYDDDCDGQTDEVLCEGETQCVEVACGGESGCEFDIKVGSPCDDEDITTRDDICGPEGVCAGTSFDCSPQKCELEAKPNGSGCDITFAPSQTPCDDEDSETWNDICDGNGNCSGAAYSCPVPTECIVVQVKDGEGCVPEYAPASTPCDDLNQETSGDICDGQGVCEGTAIVCPPGAEGLALPEGSGGVVQDDPCIVSSIPNGESCDTVFAQDGTECSDGNPATVDDICDGEGGCMGQATVCGDGYVEGLEGCDDGNKVVEDCAYGEPSCIVCNDLCQLGEGAVAGYCGDSNLDASYGEFCDGDCPTACEVIDACTTVTLTGSAENCDAFCAVEPITQCADDDGCCAPGCHANNDSDCAPVCGNQIHEEGEICDGNCPGECVAPNPCTAVVETGTVETCDQVCTITVSAVGDPCDDGDECSLASTCTDAQVCEVTELRDCIDDNPCTEDSCDPVQGCVNTVLEGQGGPCNDNGVCSVGGACTCSGDWYGSTCGILDGGWTAWGDWSACSASCGGGTQTRQRLCTNPAPVGGGAACPGDEEESQSCNTQSCCYEQEVEVCGDANCHEECHDDCNCYPCVDCFSGCVSDDCCGHNPDDPDNCCCWGEWDCNYDATCCEDCTEVCETVCDTQCHTEVQTVCP